MFTAIANPGLIAQNATTVARNVRDGLTAAQNFYAWLSAQSDGDMTGIGVTTGDLALMRSMAADLNAYSNVYHGAAPGGSYVLPYSFANSSTQVIGAQ
jgi:hypothetical protein